jgi:hypothetical protein
MHYQLKAGIWAIDATILPDQYPDCIIIVPQTFADLAQLYSPLLIDELSVAGYGRRVLPQDDQDYCALMQILPSHWQQPWDTLQRRWPQVPEVFLRHGRLSDLDRPPILLSNDAFSDAKILVPVYRNTSQKDYQQLWGQVQRLKDVIYALEQDQSAQANVNTTHELTGAQREKRTQYLQYFRELMEAEPMGDEPADAGNSTRRSQSEELEQYVDELIAMEGEPTGAKKKKRRERPEQYARRLRVWDAVKKYGTFAQAARDILDTKDPRNPRQRVLTDFDPIKHRDCPTCQTARRVEEMCPQARAYTSQDEGSLLGRLSATLDQLPDTPS